MKVLIVNRYMSVYGGAEQVVRELTLALARNNIDNAVVTLNISPEVRSRMSDTALITPKKNFPYALRSSSLRASLGIINEIRSLRELVSRHHHDFDLINVHNFPANWVAYGLGKPVVWMCNEIADFYNNPHPSALVQGVRAIGVAIDKYFVNNHTDIICVADRLNAGAVKKRYKRRSEIVPYGIDAPPDYRCLEDAKPKTYATYRISGKDFLILQVGVVSPTKNQRASVDALLALKGASPEVKLILAGPDQNPYADSLKEYIRAQGIEDRVIFTGLLKKSDIYSLYSVCNLCLFPVKLQGGYLSVFEALSVGVPVVVYPTMGAATLVEDHDLGVVSEDLVRHIKDIRQNYPFHREKSRKAGDWVRTNLTWEHFSQRLIEIFEQALRGKRS
ncbi:glycosyltransferase family 4 protein [Candidatus Omnitrophota bacterium]